MVVKRGGGKKRENTPTFSCLGDAKMERITIDTVSKHWKSVFVSPQTLSPNLWRKSLHVLLFC